MKIETKYEFGDILFLTTDPDQMERMVVGMRIYPGGIMYTMCVGTVYSDHYEMELSDARDVMKPIQNS